MQTYDADGAANILHVDRDTVLDLINTGDLPAAKIGRSWVIAEDHIAAYLHEVIARQTRERRDAIEQGGAPQRTRSEISQVRKTRKRGVKPDLPPLPVNTVNG